MRFGSRWVRIARERASSALPMRDLRIQIPYAVAMLCFIWSLLGILAGVLVFQSKTSIIVVRDALWAIGLVAGVFSLGGLGFVIVAARGLRRPVKVLTELVARIGQGDYAVQSPFHPSEKFGQLAETIRHMAEDLQRTTVSKAYGERKRLDRLKDELIGRVSHELKTPLTIIKVAVNLLGEGVMGPLSQTQTKVVRTTNQNVVRLEQLINNFLDLSRLESRQVLMHRSPVDALRLIAEVTRTFQPVAHSKRCTLAMDLPPFLPPIYGDPDRIRQVLIHLLENALRYARGHIMVTAKASDSAIHMSVSDDGPGIPQEEMARLFGKFVQINRPTGGGGYQGTGLGLAICKEIVDLHRGKIWVESVVDQGSRFHVMLPQYDREAPLPSVMRRAADQGQGQTSLALVALAVSDLDTLEARCGTTAVEQMIATMEEKIRGEGIRKTDCLYCHPRKGLIVVLAETDRRGGDMISQRLHRLATDFACSGPGGRVTPSLKVGLAVYPEHAADTVQLLDIALQNAA
ncbi:MAG: diguanylate cyclase [Elusimicrobia bacterium]|nr:diguanylate cyclase [Elusimicrobiota bacterium]